VVGLFRLDDEQVITAFAIRSDYGQADRGGLLQPFIIVQGVTPPPRVPLVETRQLDAQDCTLEAVHAVVVADGFVAVALALGVVGGRVGAGGRSRERGERRAP